MILERPSRSGLGRAACLALSALALLVLPFIATVTFGQQDEKAAKKKVVVQAFQNEQQLEQMQKELAEKLKQIEQMRARIAEMRALEAKKAGEKLKAEVKDKVRVREVARGGSTIRIEISGLPGNPEDIEKLAKKLEAMLPGKDKKVIVLRGGPGKFEFDLAVPQQWKQWAEQMKQWGQQGGAPFGVKPPAPPAARGDQKRIDGLEKKLDAIMRQLDAMRKDIKPGGK